MTTDVDTKRYCLIFSQYSANCRMSQVSYSLTNTFILTASVYSKFSAKYLDFIFNSQPNQMLWVPKRTVSVRRFFWEPTTYILVEWQGRLIRNKLSCLETPILTRFWNWHGLDISLPFKLSQKVCKHVKIQSRHLKVSIEIWKSAS